MLTVLAKDLRIEVRTREIVTTAGFFAVLIVVRASFAFHVAEAPQPILAPGAVWLPVAFASVLALGRTWQREREEGALTGLLVSPIPRAAIFCGKALGVLAFVLAVEVLVVPIALLMFHVEWLEVVPPLAIVLVCGTIGVAATGTLFGAMTVRTRARDLVLATVLFPLLSPILVSGVGVTRAIFEDALARQPVNYGEVGGWLVLIGVFDLIAVVGGVSLFGLLLEE